jgi:DNA-binding NarL/FixJ family response regulator
VSNPVVRAPEGAGEVATVSLPGPSPVAVAVHAVDPVLRAGVAAQLRAWSEPAEPGDPDQAAVAVVAADELDDPTLHLARRAHKDGGRPVVLVLSRLDSRTLLAGVEAGASGFVRRADAVPDRLVPVVVAASRGEASIPPDLVSGLLDQLNPKRRGENAGAAPPEKLNRREIEVLRLASEGLETAEIARQLSYSERTVKGVIHDITTRYHLRNRTHAVAYAVRLGLI